MPSILTADHTHELAERIRTLTATLDAVVAGAALGRSLDEHEIVRGLARVAACVVPADGVIVAHPDLDAGVVHTSARVVRGLSCPRAEQPLGTGAIAIAARSGTAVRMNDYDADRSLLAAEDDVAGDAGPAGSVLAVPMRVGTALLGVVAVHADAAHAFDDGHEAMLRAVVAQGATAIANARLFAESEAERRQSDALADVARAASASLRFGDVMRLVLRHTVALLRARGACVALQRDEYLHVVAGIGSAGRLSGVHVPLDGTMMGATFREGRTHISNDVDRDSSFERRLRQVAPADKVVLVPLVGADGPIGVIAAMDRVADFTERDARVLRRLADQVAVAIVNARLFEQVTDATREWKVAFDAIAAGMVVLDERGSVRRCNQRAAELTGHATPKALLGADFRDAIGLTDAATADAGGDRVDVVGRALVLREMARETVHTSRAARWLDVLAAPHPDGGAVVTFDDVSAHHTLAEQLVQRERLATVGRLVRGLAHEVDNPLASVLSLADLLVDEATPLSAADVRDAARAIRAESRRALRIMERLDAFARQRAPERTATDINRVVLDALELRRHALRVQDVDLAVALDYEAPLTWADAGQLQQVCVQVLAVAEQSLVRSGGDRCLTIATRRREAAFELSFADSGPARDDAAVERLLDPVAWGGDDDPADAASLAAASAIVREHGGTLDVTRPRDGGTVVVVRLPYVPPPSSALLAAVAE